MVTGNNHRVLIVDDVEYVQMMYRQAFADQNFEMQFAKFGAEAVSIHDSWRPHLIILDIKLPDMNGIQVLSEIRAKDKDVHVIMSTAFNMAELVRQAASLGVTHFLAKPVDIDDVLTRIQKIFGELPTEATSRDQQVHYKKALANVKQDTKVALQLLIQEDEQEMLKMQVKAMLDDLIKLEEQPPSAMSDEDAVLHEGEQSPLQATRETFALRRGRLRRTVRSYESKGKDERVTATLKTLIKSLDEFLAVLGEISDNE